MRTPISAGSALQAALRWAIVASLALATPALADESSEPSRSQAQVQAAIDRQMKLQTELLEESESRIELPERAEPAAEPGPRSAPRAPGCASFRWRSSTASPGVAPIRHLETKNARS